jgi:hypothetical protein
MAMVAEKLFPCMGDGDHALLLNNLGGATELEMAVLAEEIARSALAPKVRWVIGPAALMTSLDMQGFSEHALGADVEQLDDAFFVGGDNREIGTGEDRGLQGPRFQQRFLAPHFGGAIRLAGCVRKGESAYCFGHRRSP